jgi:hypothetical protein
MDEKLAPDRDIFDLAKAHIGLVVFGMPRPGL